MAAPGVCPDLLGSPRAVLWFYRLQLLEGAFGSGLWLLVLPLAIVAARLLGDQAEEGARRTIPGVPQTLGWVVYVFAYHALLLLFRLPGLVHLYRRCRQLVDDFELLQLPIGQDMCQLLRSGDMRINQALSVQLLALYVVGLVVMHMYLSEAHVCRWLGLGRRSCGAMVAVQFCALELSILWGAIVFALGLTGSRSVHANERHFMPVGLMGPSDSDGIQHKYKVAVHEFPCYRSEPSMEDGQDRVCTICLNDVKQGDMVRKLPCGHCYHRECIDTWLKHSPSCPLRCHVAFKYERVESLIMSL